MTTSDKILRVSIGMTVVGAVGAVACNVALALLGG